MDEHYLKRMFSRRRRPSPNGNTLISNAFVAEFQAPSVANDSPVTPSEHATTRPSTAFSKVTARGLLSPFQTRHSADLLRPSSDIDQHPRKSFSGLSRATTIVQSIAHSANKRRDRNISLPSRSADDAGASESARARSSLDHRLMPEDMRREPTNRGWLRRLKSRSFRSMDLRSTPDSTSPQSMQILHAHGHRPTRIPDLGEMRDVGHEQPKPRADLSSGAAARAAAAAQNELLDNMRRLRLSESKLTRDSESGIGIERGDSTISFEIPVVRQGIPPGLFLQQSN